MSIVTSGFGDGSLILQGFGSGEPELEPFEVSLYRFLSEHLTAPVFIGHIPQDQTEDCYSFSRVSEDPLYNLNGDYLLSEVEMQIDCWSMSGGALPALELERKLKVLLLRFRGMMGLTQVSSSELTNTIHLNEPPINDSDEWTYHYVTRWDFTIKEQNGF